MKSSDFPTHAEIVIVGVGGIVGSMLAYWLAELGQKNIVGLEKSTVIPSDIASTAHASDFVYNTTHDKLGRQRLLFKKRWSRDLQKRRRRSMGGVKTKGRIRKSLWNQRYLNFCC